MQSHTDINMYNVMNAIPNTELTAVLEAERMYVRFEGGLARGRDERTCSHIHQHATYYPKEGMHAGRTRGGGGESEKDQERD